MRRPNATEAIDEGGESVSAAMNCMALFLADIARCTSDDTSGKYKKELIPMRKIASILLPLCLVLALLVSAAWAGELDEEYLWHWVRSEDPAIEYSGHWIETDDEATFSGKELLSPRSSAYAEFTFHGTAVRWMSSTGPSRGQVDIYLNDRLMVEGLDTYSESIEQQKILFEEKDLEEGTHTLRIDPTGEMREGVPFAHVAIDAFGYMPPLPNFVDHAQEVLDASTGEAPVTIGDRLESYHLPADRTELRQVIDSTRDVLGDEDADRETMAAAVVDLNRSVEAFREKVIRPVVPDLSGAGNDGTIVGSPLWVPGRFNKALLTYPEDLIEIDAQTFPTGSEMSIELWHFGDLALNSSVIRGWDDEGHSNRTFVVHLTWGDENVYFDCGNDGGSYDRINTSVADRYYGWHHWAFTKNAETGIMRIYRNGEVILEGEEKELPINETVVAYIGQNHLGILDELRIWGYERSEEEIIEQMNAELTGEEEGLAAYWNFNSLDGAQ